MSSDLAPSTQPPAPTTEADANLEPTLVF
ncbi:hypothetical protein Q604_UNBC01302G0002, partial [human gut metagenome]